MILAYLHVLIARQPEDPPHRVQGHWWHGDRKALAMATNPIRAADDAPAIVALLTRLQARERCAVPAADHAVARARGVHRDVRPLDRHIRGVDGMGADVRRRAAAPPASIPVIMVSAAPEVRARAALRAPRVTHPAHVSPLRPAGPSQAWRVASRARPLWGHGQAPRTVQRRAVGRLSACSGGPGEQR